MSHFLAHWKNVGMNNVLYLLLSYSYCCCFSCFKNFLKFHTTSDISPLELKSSALNIRHLFFFFSLLIHGKVFQLHFMFQPFIRERERVNVANLCFMLSLGFILKNSYSWVNMANLSFFTSVNLSWVIWRISHISFAVSSCHLKHVMDISLTLFWFSPMIQRDSIITLFGVGNVFILFHKISN